MFGRIVDYRKDLDGGEDKVRHGSFMGRLVNERDESNGSNARNGRLDHGWIFRDTLFIMPYNANLILPLLDTEVTLSNAWQ
jgi:hypothetical protein